MSDFAFYVIYIHWEQSGHLFTTTFAINFSLKKNEKNVLFICIES